VALEPDPSPPINPFVTGARPRCRQVLPMRTLSMHSLPAWTIWAIVVPLVLLSPVIAFFLALAAEIVIGGVIDAGAPALLLIGAGVGGLVLVRRLRRTRERPTLESQAAR
jgi:hypothetical protein